MINEYLNVFDIANEQLKWIEIFSQISDYQNTQENWDGAGAIPPSEHTISSLAYYLNVIKDNGLYPAPDRAVISTDGDIIIEWQRPHCIFELETSTPGVGEWMFTPDEGEPFFLATEWDLPYDKEYFPSDINHQLACPVGTTWNETSRLLVA